MERKDGGIKDGGIMVISDIEAKATIAAVSDGERARLTLGGEGRLVMPMIEEIIRSVMIEGYKVAAEEKGESEALEACAKTLTRLFNNTQKRILASILKERFGSIDGLKEAASDALFEALAEQADLGIDDDDDEEDK